MVDTDDVLGHCARRCPPSVTVGEGRPPGAEAFLAALQDAAVDPTQQHSDMTAAFNNPLAELHRQRKWQQKQQHEERGQQQTSCDVGSLAAMLASGRRSSEVPLARRVALAESGKDLLSLAAELEASAPELPRAEALQTARQLGTAAHEAVLGENVRAAAELHRAALALIVSVASRASDIEEPEELVQVLEAMRVAGVGVAACVDMCLAALHARLAQGHALPPALALRAADMLEWAAVALVAHPHETLELGPGARRAVEAIARALSSNASREALGPGPDCLGTALSALVRKPRS